MIRKYGWIAGLLLVAAACRPEIKGELGPQYDLSKGLQGTWSLNAVEVEDRSFPTFTTQSFTDYFQQNAVSISFQTESQTYTVTGPEKGHPFGKGGDFAFDDPQYPSQIILYQDKDTATLQLGNMVREIDPAMTLRDMKSACGETYARYTYQFERVQN